MDISLMSSQTLSSFLSEKQLSEDAFIAKAKEILIERVKCELKRELFDVPKEKVVSALSGKSFTVDVLDIFSEKGFASDVSPKVRHGYYISIWSWFVAEIGKVAEDCDCSVSITGSNLKGSLYGEYNEVQRWTVSFKLKDSKAIKDMMSEAKIVIEK